MRASIKNPWSLSPENEEAMLGTLLVLSIIALPIALVYHGCREEPAAEQAAMVAGSQPTVVRMCPDCAHRLTCQECGRPLPSHTKDQQK